MRLPIKKRQIMHLHTHQIRRAKKFGTDAYKRGIVRRPSADKHFLALLFGRVIGITPPGEASNGELFRAWLVGYDGENRF